MARADNPRKSPYGYELDARSLLRANELDEEGYEVGVYHSHPRSPAEPSQTDINLATYPHWLYLIVSLAGDPEVRAWRIADGRPPRRRSRSNDHARGGAQPLACPSCALRYGLDERFCAKCRMPLVYVGRDPVEAPVSDAHDRARKIDPRYTEGELVRVAGGRNQAEAELIQGMLLEEGVPSILRRTAGFDVPDFLAAGPRDVLVPSAGAEVAREVLLEADMAPPPPVAERLEPAEPRGAARGRDRRRRRADRAGHLGPDSPGRLSG